MPRTKVSKTSKRNREATNREEKIREFENSLDGFQFACDSQISCFISEYDNELKMLLQRTSRGLLQTKIWDLFEMDLMKLSDYEKMKQLNASSGACLLNSTNSIVQRSGKGNNPNDEGYLTEDSSAGGSIGGSAVSSNATAFLSTNNAARSQLQQQQSARLRTPGPLNSARARRPRRSRSACGDFPGSAIKAKASALNSASGHNISNNIQASEHNARSKMRTPMASRTKALSADRTPKAKYNQTCNSPPATFLRWPKPGELALSISGSPLVAQVLPDRFANVNIPLRNGVISLRPKKLAEFQPDILDGIDPETLDQIKTLHANLHKIVSMADKAASAGIK